MSFHAGRSPMGVARCSSSMTGWASRGEVGRTDRNDAAICPDRFVEARREVGRRCLAAGRPAPQAVDAEADAELSDELVPAEPHG